MSGQSAPVKTPRTLAAAAAAVSIFLISAWAWGLKRTAACSVPARTVSSV